MINRNLKEQVDKDIDSLKEILTESENGNKGNVEELISDWINELENENFGEVKE